MGQDIQESHADYISYLNQNEANLAAIRDVHQQFVEDYIQQQIQHTQKSTFSKWWNNLAGGLSQISDNRNFLLLFKGLTAVSTEDQSIIKVDTLKQAITALLNEYLDESWFVNSARKDAVRQLKDRMVAVKTPKDLLNLLSTHRIDVIEADIKANASRIKELNLFGTSRYQNTLDKALSLTQALTGEKAETDMMSSLHKNLNLLTRTSSAETPYQKHKTLDALQYEMQNSSVPKWATAAVLRKSLDKAVETQMQQKEFKGMLDRFSLFSQNRPVDKEKNTPAPDNKPATS